MSSTLIIKQSQIQTYIHQYIPKITCVYISVAQKGCNKLFQEILQFSSLVSSSMWSSFSLSLSLSLSLSFFLFSLSLSLFFLSLYLSIYLHVYLSISLSLYIFLSFFSRKVHSTYSIN